MAEIMREAEIDASSSNVPYQHVDLVGDSVQFGKMTGASWVLTWWPIHRYAMLAPYQIYRSHFGVAAEVLIISCFEVSFCATA